MGKKEKVKEVINKIENKQTPETITNAKVWFLLDTTKTGKFLAKLIKKKRWTNNHYQQ